MQAYSVEKVIDENGIIQLSSLPFSAGDTVQIIVLPSKSSVQERDRPSLKDSVIEYVDPLEPVAGDEQSAPQ